MTIEQLRIFIGVAEHLHVTRAAESLGLTQSGASAAISALETRYGFSLFHRVGRRIELTAAGRTFLPAARAVLAQVGTAEITLAELSAMKRGELSIWASQTIANYWLPARIACFRERYPNIELNVQIGNTRQVAHAVLEGVAGLGFAEGVVEEPTLEQTQILGDRLVLVLGANHPWAHRRKIELRELSKLSWILRETGSGTRQFFEAALRKLDIDPTKLKVSLELPSNEAVLAAVECGTAATVVSELVVRQRKGLHSLGLGLDARPFRVLRHRERFQTAAERAMMTMVVEPGDTTVHCRVGDNCRRSQTNLALRVNGGTSSQASTRRKALSRSSLQLT